jgi:hypothetical protein
MRVDCFGRVSESTTEIMMDNVFKLDVNHSHKNAEDAGDYVNRAGRRWMRPMQEGMS